jgi:hypothetical protein
LELKIKSQFSPPLMPLAIKKMLQGGFGDF